MAKGYGVKSIIEGGKGNTIDVAAATTECIGKGHLRSSEDAINLRVRLKISASAGTGTMTAKIYHAPTGADTVTDLSKDITITADGEWYAIINASDTSLIPLMPFIEVRVTSTGTRTCTVDRCDLFKVI